MEVVQTDKEKDKEDNEDILSSENRLEENQIEWDS